MTKIIYTPPESSNYTGMLSGIFYIDGKVITEEEFRKYIVECTLKRVKEEAAKQLGGSPDDYIF